MTTQTPQRTEPSANVIIGLLVGSAFVMILNETIMSVALPVLITDLNITARTAQWLTSGFLLTMAVVIPMSGSLLQRFPVRTIFVASMTLFCTGTLVAALAPGFAVLLVAVDVRDRPADRTGRTGGGPSMAQGCRRTAATESDRPGVGAAVGDGVRRPGIRADAAR